MMTYVCLECLKDPHLRKALRTGADPCNYCEREGPTASLFSVAQACDDVLDAHFELGRGGYDLLDTLSNLKVVPTDALDDLMEELNDVWFDRDSMESKYPDVEDLTFMPRTTRDDSVGDAWSKMERSLQYEARYVNPDAVELLDAVLGGIHADRTAGGEAVVSLAGPGREISRLFRARVFEKESGLQEALTHPAKLLGTPAAGVAAAGRMNARGQSVFYGATSAEIALAEVRPPVGSLVGMAAFDLTREVKLLDLRKLEAVEVDTTLSLFDPKSIEMAQRRDFLRTLCSRIVQPVMPEAQDRDYLITQVIADYLATRKDAPVDGIIYPSVQVTSTGCNVALFPKSSRVKDADAESIGKAYLWEAEGDGDEVEVFWFPRVALSKPPEFNQGGPRVYWDEPVRLVTLETVFDLVSTHKVKSIALTATATPVAYDGLSSFGKQPPSLRGWRKSDVHR